MSLMPDTSNFSRHPMHSVEANGLQYHYIEAGQGPAVILLHGFPDLANTWDDTIDALKGEYRCIAPALRGYFPTAIPADGDYKVATIAQDIGALASALGIDQFMVIGQDWGASIAYTLANVFPKRVARLVGIAVPHPRYIKPSLNG